MVPSSDIKDSIIIFATSSLSAIEPSHSRYLVMNQTTLTMRFQVGQILCEAVHCQVSLNFFSLGF